MRRSAVHLIVTLGLGLASAPLWAGIVDSPLPAPFKQHVFSVPGVVNNGGLATFFSCTNLDAANMTVGVELFGPLGGGPINDAAATSLNVSPGGTVIFGTSFAAGIVIDSSLPAGPFSKGSARILATSKKVACTAYIADVLGAVPTTGWHLTIIAKTKQKAAN